MLKVIVKYVEKYLLKISIQNKCFVRVLALESTGKSETVYDLTVEENHEYFANGILVHNCIDALRYVLNSAMYYSVKDDEPMTEAELFPDRRGFRRSNDYSMNEKESMYGELDNYLFGDSDID